MTRNATARVAGLLYLATLPTAGFAYGYVAFMPKGDPAALLTALEAGRQALGWSVVLGAAGFVDYLLLAALFHRLLAPTGKVAADLLVLFVAASVPLALAALAHRLDGSRQLRLLGQLHPAHVRHCSSACGEWHVDGRHAGQRVRLHVLADRQGSRVARRVADPCR